MVTCLACVFPALLIGLEERYGPFSRLFNVTAGPFVASTINFAISLSLAAGLFVQNRDWKTRISYSLCSLAVVMVTNCAGWIAAVISWGAIRG